MIHSACITFNKSNILGYLESCWKVVSTNVKVMNSLTVIHLCSAHIMHRLSHNLDKKFKIQKSFKHLTLHVFAVILKAKSMQEINRVFVGLSNILSIQYYNDTVSSSLVELNGLVRGDMLYQLDYVEPPEDDSTQVENATTYRAKSPFGRHFDSLVYKNRNDVKTDKISMLNGCYCPDIFEYLLTYYMPILPLWTGIILSQTGDEEETKASNAIAENWFRIVKHPIFESNIHFIRTMYSNIYDRISAFKFGFHPLASRIFKAKKRKLEVPNEEDCKEKWSRRSKIHRSYTTPDIDNVDKFFDKCYLTLNNNVQSKRGKYLKRKILEKRELLKKRSYPQPLMWSSRQLMLILSLTSI